MRDYRVEQRPGGDLEIYDAGDRHVGTCNNPKLLRWSNRTAYVGGTWWSLLDGQLVRAHTLQSHQRGMHEAAKRAAVKFLKERADD